MKGKQLTMDAVLEEYDSFREKREIREAIEKIDRLDKKYGRMNFRRLMNAWYPEGSVVIIAQNLFRDGRYKWHFYRTVLSYWSTRVYKKPIFVEATNEEYPERPPWADTVGHEGEKKDIEWFADHIHWATGEIVEPIKTWWMLRWAEE